MILLDVKNAELYGEYARAASAIEARHGGRPLVVGDVSEVVEGRWPAERVVILEFPSMEDLRGWYEDPEYRALIPDRRQATDSRILFMEGWEPLR